MKQLRNFVILICFYLLFCFPYEMQVAVNEFGGRERKEDLSVVLCSVLKVCLGSLRGIYNVQFTSISVINKVIDISVNYDVYLTKADQADYLHHPFYIMK